MVLSKLFAVGALALAATASAQTFVYEFDGATTGVQGNIKVQYASPASTKATVSADLDFSKVDLAELQKFEGNCSSEVTEFTWHIHVKWSSAKTSEKLAQCGLALTGNHYDPTFACGPNSEHFQDPKCADKIKSYTCNPASYAKDPLACEKGDLSGKFGRLKLDGSKKVRSSWTDEHYPALLENSPQWNMIVHAVCGKATPRVACAVGKKTQDLCADQ
ncbi:hypothetical protein PINS_up006841 [Pythium insidiosum]|nr:hypothetical protein PINS_up006841 [Pythium insidiosum]